MTGSTSRSLVRYPLIKLLPALLVFGVSGVAAQPVQQSHAPTNVVNIAASGFLEVQQDWLTMNLNTTKEGPDAGTVQNQLKVALESALAVARAAARPQQLELRTGPFNIYPRYGRDSKISGWQGRAELVLEGRDFAAISATAGKIQTLSMGNVGFSLSRQAQQQLESDVQAMAIERFKVRAGEVAKGFGFSGYSIREVSISSSDQGAVSVRPRMMAMEAKSAMAEAPVPVEAGQSTVSVTVSGSIQMR